MTDSPYRVGAFVCGPPTSPRDLVRHGELLAAYADGAIGDEREAYLSHFAFGAEMQAHYKANRNSVAGFAGPCAARWVVLDIDRPELAVALEDARRLLQAVTRRYPETEGDVPVYFSGNKGFHVLVELAHGPPPAVGFQHTPRTFAEALAALAGVAIDAGIYDVNRLVRLPNTRHPKTGLFKRRIDSETLFRLELPGILETAKRASGDGIPTVRLPPAQLAKDWAAAERHAAGMAEARAAVRRECGTADARAPRDLIDLLRFGVADGERHMTLFRVAAWMVEQGAGTDFTRLFLTEAAGDLGLPPDDVARQIKCGVGHALKQQQSEGGQSP